MFLPDSFLFIMFVVTVAVPPTAAVNIQFTLWSKMNKPTVAFRPSNVLEDGDEDAYSGELRSFFVQF